MEVVQTWHWVESEHRKESHLVCMELLNKDGVTRALLEVFKGREDIPFCNAIAADGTKRRMAHRKMELDDIKTWAVKVTGVDDAGS